MKRLLVTLFVGLALVACSKSTTDQNTNTDTNTQNESTSSTADTQSKYLEDLGFKDVKNVNGTKYYQTYTLDEAIAVDENVYNQWMYTWVEPADYMKKDIDVYQYTATKDSKNYDVYVMTDRDNNVIGGYYYEQGKTMADAKILNEKYTTRIANDFKSTWDKLFNINQ